jgi:hypothetical protein
MNSLWSITMEDYMEVVRRAREAGVQPGDSMEAIFIEYMNEKGQKPFAHNEFNKEELLNDLSDKCGKILEINTDTQGKQSYRVMKTKEENKEE